MSHDTNDIIIQSMAYHPRAANEFGSRCRILLASENDDPFFLRCLHELCRNIKSSRYD